MIAKLHRARQFCDFSIFSGTGVLFHVPNNMYDWTVGAIISGLGAFLCALFCAPPPPLRPLCLCGPRARAGAATGGFFSEEVQSRAYAPPHASFVYHGPAFHYRRPTP